MAIRFKVSPEGEKWLAQLKAEEAKQAAEAVAKREAEEKAKRSAAAKKAAETRRKNAEFRKANPLIEGVTIEYLYYRHATGVPRWNSRCWSRDLREAELVIRYKGYASNAARNRREVSDIEEDIIDTFHRLVGKVTEKRRNQLWETLPFYLEDTSDKELMRWFKAAGLCC